MTKNFRITYTVSDDENFTDITGDWIWECYADDEIHAINQLLSSYVCGRARIYCIDSIERIIDADRA